MNPSCCLTSESVDTGAPFARMPGRNRLALEVFFAIEEASVILLNLSIWPLLSCKEEMLIENQTPYLMIFDLRHL